MRERLAHLDHANEIAVVAVAVLADGDVEVELGVALVGLRLAQVPGRARAAHHDAGEAPVEAVLEAHHADVDVALLEDAVVGQQALDVVEDLGVGLGEGVDVVDELRRQVHVHAADAEILGVHAAARGALVEDHELLALLEAPQRRRERADVHRLRGDVEQVRQQAADLAEEHADQLSALGHLEAQKLLRRQAEGVLLVHGRDVVEPVEIADGLQVGLVLDQLLGAAVQKADMGIDALHHLAVELEHKAQHAVGGRVLRPEVDVELADVGLAHQLCPSSIQWGDARELGLLVDALHEAGPRDDHALVLPLADHVDAVVRLDVKGDAPAGDLGAFGIDGHRLSRHGRRGVRDVDVHTEAPSPGSRCGSSTLRQVHSIRPTMKPVANTVGISRNSGASG